ncbi:MAG: tyrosine-type recombinase/integrase [Synechococcaceae cyanobacterium RL_1_2]|nr:tyrosine-type recombinase/integrase [Synechococcaceae cyanobacterium RL_1_2]
MYSQTPSGKAPKGTVKIIASNGRLQLRFRHAEKRHYLSMGLPDTPTNQIAAKRKAEEIYLDIVSGNFDHSLNKYKPQIKANIDQNDANTTTKQLPTVQDILKQYIEYKQSSWKITTLGDRQNLARILTKIAPLPITAALEVKTELQKITTADQTRRLLIQLNAACRWGLKHKIVSSNPFEGMATEMPKPNYQKNPQPNAFTEEERDLIIEKFQNHRGNWNGKGFTGYSYYHYAPFVEFLFLTGCRPSEAIGLRWINVAKDCHTVKFAEAITMAGVGRPIRVENSKNNKQRLFPCSERLKKLLSKLKSDECEQDSLVFPSPKGKPINYNNFSHNAWKRIVDPIKVKTTPYQCRDTFITVQILKGIPEYIIAQWCDTSVYMIQKHYADFLKMISLKPID